MTLDVTIGKIRVDREEGRPHFWVVQCPDAEKDICDKEHTLWVREAYRSGSTGFWRFFKEEVGKTYYKMRDTPDHNDRDVAYIKPFLEEINNLPVPENPTHKDRMKWFKYWSNKAVELYDEEAAIMFS